MSYPAAPLIKKLCLLCNVEFEIKDTNRNKNRQFCSGKCAKTYNGSRNKGRKHSPEVNKKKGLSGNKNSFYGKHHTDNVKQKLRERVINKTWEEIYGEEKAAKMRESASESKRGELNSFYGRHHTIESKELIGSHIRGEKNPFFGKGWPLYGDKNGAWCGGISKLYRDYGGKFTNELKTEIRKRDKFTCVVCHKHGYIVHHVDYDKLNNNKSNLITLCNSCHAKTNFNRKSWEGFFTILMENL